jgi:hypothetical protein
MSEKFECIDISLEDAEMLHWVHYIVRGITTLVLVLAGIIIHLGPML